MTSAPTPRPVEILVVEDSEADLMLTKRALARGTTVAHRITVACDGEEALDCLFRRGAFSAAPMPDLVLLDLNLPRLNGLEVLAAIRSNPATTHIPVIVLTGSDAESDIARAYQLHANSYLTKAVQLDAFVKAMAALATFWLSVVKLPPPGGAGRE